MSDSDSSPQPTNAQRSPSHWAGRLWLVGMGLAIAAAGGFFLWFLWKNFDVATEMDPWVETPCQILAATVDDSQINQHFETVYEFQVSYRYEFDGETYLGEQVKSKELTSGVPKKLEKWQRRFVSGEASVCYVNPKDPEEAVLVRDTKASIYSLWFPGLFVVGGLGMALSALVSGLRRR